MKTKTFAICVALLVAFGFAFGANKKQENKIIHPWTIISLAPKYNTDEANFLRYAQANAKVVQAPVAVFMGDSITDAWARLRPEFFINNNYAGRGIGGQVSSQMLVRFRADVIALKPRIVLILAGTNDIARNKGYISEENIVGNVISMCEISKANGIIPVICSILPAAKYPWRKVIKPVEAIKRVNSMLKTYADANGITYLDYYSKLDDGNGGLSHANAKDGVHPTPQCYVIMEEMAVNAINSTLAGK